MSSGDIGKDATEDRLSQAIFFCFAAFLFFLPLYEAPKNIFSVLFVFLGGWDAFRRKIAADRFKRKDPEAWAFLLLAMSPFVAGLNSPYMDWASRLSNAFNWALIPLVPLVMLLLNFSKDQLIFAARCVCFSTIFGVTEAFYSWQGRFPELNSVGHVNQSALYLAFALIPAIFLVSKSSGKMDIGLALVSILVVFVYQGSADSLVGFGTSLYIIFGMWSIYCAFRRRFKMLCVSAALAVGFASLFVVVPSDHFGHYESVKREFDRRLNDASDPFAYRDKLVNTALELAGDSYTGFGLGSFKAASDISEIRRRVEAGGLNWAIEKSMYFSSTHGHNLFANVLVERGWFGVVSIALFLCFLLVRFMVLRACVESLIGAVTASAIVFSGLGQSSLHVEHGALALVCISFCLASARQKPKNQFHGL